MGSSREIYAESDRYPDFDPAAFAGMAVDDDFAVMRLYPVFQIGNANPFPSHERIKPLAIVGYPDHYSLVNPANEDIRRRSIGVFENIYYLLLDNPVNIEFQVVIEG